MGVFSKIFNRESVRWFKVFDTEAEAAKQIPLHKSVAILIEGNRYCLARTNEGYYAVADECPHSKAALSKGWCNANGEIVCPWHNYRFDLKLGDETTGKGLHLATFKVELRTDGLFVGI